MRKTIVSITNQFRKSVENLRSLFAKPEAKIDPQIALLAAEKTEVKVDISAHIPEIIDAANWTYSTYVEPSDEWERQIRKPNRINKKLSYRKKKSQAKNWDKWKRKGVN